MIELICRPEVLLTFCSSKRDQSPNSPRTVVRVTHGPDTADRLPAALFEEDDIEAVANAVRRGRDARQTRPDDSYPLARQLLVWRWGPRREDQAEDVLEEVVEPDVWQEEDIVDELVHLAGRRPFGGIGPVVVGL